MQSKVLLVYFGSALQCDATILEALFYAMPPTVRHILERLPNECLEADLVEHFEAFKSGWSHRNWKNFNRTLQIFSIYPPTSRPHDTAFAGELTIQLWSFGPYMYVYEHHLKDPKFYTILVIDKKANSHSLRIVHLPVEGNLLTVAVFKEELMNLKTLKERLLFANEKLYELIKID